MRKVQNGVQGATSLLDFFRFFCVFLSIYVMTSGLTCKIAPRGIVLVSPIHILLKCPEKLLKKSPKVAQKMPICFEKLLCFNKVAKKLPVS